MQSNEAYSFHIQTLLLGRIPTFRKVIDQVVDITSARDSCDDGCSYRAEFVTSEGEQVPLSDVYTDQGPVRAQVDDLRPQLQQRVETITYHVDPAWWLLLLFGGLTLMTILLAPLVFLRRR